MALWKLQSNRKLGSPRSSPSEGPSASPSGSQPHSKRRRSVGLLIVGAVLAVVLAACNGFATQPTGINQTSATLQASVECTSGSPNPCDAWFQYWQDGGSIQTTTPVQTNTSTNGYFDFSQTVTGLTPGALYHYQVCGYGDGIDPPGLCVSPDYTGGLDAVNSPGTKPASGDLSATDNFRTGTSTQTPTVDLDRVLTGADTSSNPISRDGGVSAAYASGEDLWVFGDTSQVGGPSTTLGTAADGPYTVGAAPNSLSEIPAGSSPSPFFKKPSGLDANGEDQACAIPAAWVSGAATVPGTSTVLLTYEQVCDGSNFLAERLSLVEYTPSTGTFGTIYTPFAGSPLYDGLPPVESFGSPVYGSDGYLYLFTNSNDTTANDPDGFYHTGLFVARIKTTSDLGKASNYKWWSQPTGQGAGWYGEADAQYALPVIPCCNFGATVANYSASTSKDLAAIVQTGLGASTFQVYEATSPAGSWTAGPVGQVPDDCDAGAFGCYAIYGHPELSTSTQLVFSWYSSDDRNGAGHVRVGAMAW
jgi:hypothetical protein